MGPGQGTGPTRADAIAANIAFVSRKEDLTISEAESWRALRRSIAAIPAESREEPLLANGWSVKDVEWHIAFWWQDCVRTLESLVRGEYSEYDGDTDAINEEALQQGRSVGLEEAESTLDVVRERLMLVWAESPDDPRAGETFSGETIEHYEEHADDLAAAAARFADGSS